MAKQPPPLPLAGASCILLLHSKIGRNLGICGTEPVRVVVHVQRVLVHEVRDRRLEFARLRPEEFLHEGRVLRYRAAQDQPGTPRSEQHFCSHRVLLPHLCISFENSVAADGGAVRTGGKTEEDVVHTKGFGAALLCMVRSIGGRVSALVLPRAYIARTALVLISGPAKPSLD